MSEQAAVIDAPPQAPTGSPAQSPGFLGGGSPEPVPAAQNQPFNLFSESVAKDGKFVEGWTAPLAERYPSLAGKIANAKDQDSALSMMDWAVRTASGKALKGAPNDTWTENDVADYRKTYGVPEKPEEYKFKPATIETGVHWPEDSGIEQFFHENHVPAPVAEKLGEKFHEYLKEQTTHAQQIFEAKTKEAGQAAIQNLSREWGSDFAARDEANAAFIEATFGKEGMKDPLIRAALNDERIYRLIDEVRAGRREGKIPGTGLELSAGSRNMFQQAKDLMGTPEYKRGDKEVVARVNDFMRQQAAIDSRTGKRSF